MVTLGCGQFRQYAPDDASEGPLDAVREEPPPIVEDTPLPPLDQPLPPEDLVPLDQPPPPIDEPSPPVDTPLPVDVLAAMDVPPTRDIPLNLDVPVVTLDTPAPRDTGNPRDLVIVDVGPRCTIGLTECNNVCVDLTNDRLHCGACNRACTTGQNCALSACTTPPAPCGAMGQTCCAGTSCASGLTCQNGTCNRPPPVCALTEGQMCAGGTTGPNCCVTNYQCSATRDASTRCCRGTGAPCTQDRGCCGDALCLGGVCFPSAACYRTGRVCTNPSFCCPNGRGARACVYNLGVDFERTCAEPCESNNDCDSGCCATAQPGNVRVCSHPRRCGQAMGCNLMPGARCDRTDQCCDANGGARSTICDTAPANGAFCTRLCAMHADCPGSACSLNSLGEWRCLRSSP